jgi:hypothetical protein
MERDKYLWAHPRTPIPGETVDDFRQRAEAEAAERRGQQLVEQSSPLNSPSVRIGAWERLHQIDLPRDPTHRLVALIAANTGLTADEVRAEQLSRTASKLLIPVPTVAPGS